jgi:hypothetical protein
MSDKESSKSSNFDMTISELLDAYIADPAQFPKLYRRICQLDLKLKQDKSQRLATIHKQIEQQQRALEAFSSFQKKWKGEISSSLSQKPEGKVSVPEIVDVDLATFREVDSIPSELQ